jgi:hypothetical protein
VAGWPTTLTATVSAGSHVTYLWDFGDGAAGAGATVTHTYPDVDVYTALVTAVNPVSVLTATTPVTIAWPQVGFSSVAYHVPESKGAALITVTLNVPPALTATVDYSTTHDGSAIAGADYVAVSGTLVFSPGLSLQTFSVPLLDDELDEEDEYLILSLRNPSRLVLGVFSLTTLTILDDDPVFLVYLPLLVQHAPMPASGLCNRCSPDANAVRR